MRVYRTGRAVQETVLDDGESEWVTTGEQVRAIGPTKDCSQVRFSKGVAIDAEDNLPKTKKKLVLFIVFDQDIFPE